MRKPFSLLLVEKWKLSPFNPVVPIYTHHSKVVALHYSLPIVLVYLTAHGIASYIDWDFVRHEELVYVMTAMTALVNRAPLFWWLSHLLIRYEYFRVACCFLLLLLLPA